MPTYAYKCLDCGYQVEYFQSIKEPPRTECPQCHGRIVREVTSGAGLIFKGSGFYVNDYKKPGDNGGSSSGSSKPKPAASPEIKDKATASGADT